MTDSELLAEAIVQNGWYKKGDFTLSSGINSKFYIDLRPCLLSTRYLHLATTSMTNVLMRQVCLNTDDLLCGVLTSGLFLAGAMMQKLSSMRECSGIYCRTEHRGHGGARRIEGEYEKGQSVVIIDDVATSGASIQRVAGHLKEHGLKVKAAAVLVDREEGAVTSLARLGVPLCSALTLSGVRAMDARICVGDDPPGLLGDW